MIFVFDNNVYELDIRYDDFGIDAPTFIFTNDMGHGIVTRYYSIHEGGHQRCIKKWQNGHLHGIQYGWFDIHNGGRQRYIENYQNGRQHGIQYRWYTIQTGGHQRYVENYQNGRKHGIQQYWNCDMNYHTAIY